MLENPFIVGEKPSYNTFLPAFISGLGLATHGQRLFATY